MLVTDAEVVGLSVDGGRLVLRVEGRTVEVLLEDVRRAERRAARRPIGVEPLTPRIVQQRIRCGESAKEVALSGGWPVEAVERYEGPPLAERQHQASAARRSEVEGQAVEELVARHLRQPIEELEWDAWLVEDTRWEVRAAGGGQAVRLRWDTASRRVQALDEPGRRALREAAVDGDALTAVLRPVSSSRDSGIASAPPTKSSRRAHAEVPGWSDIARQVTGREQLSPDEG